MRQQGKVFQVSITLFSIMLGAGTVPAYAGSITINSIERYVNGFGGSAYGYNRVDFGHVPSSSPGLFSEIVSGSGTLSISNETTTTLGSVSGAAYQFSNVSLLGDALTVDAAMGTSLQMSTSSPLPPGISGPSWQGQAESSLRLTFTLHDWASYSATHLLAGDTQWGARPFDNQEVSLRSSSFIAFYERPEVNDRHSGVLAPGTYEYTVFSGGGTDSAGDLFGGSSTYATSLVITRVPEPSSLLLLACGVGLLAASRWVHQPV